jgi:hypothetical protein
MCHGFELYFLFAMRELGRIGGERGLDKISPESGNGRFCPRKCRCVEAGGSAVQLAPAALAEGARPGAPVSLGVAAP